MTASVTTVNATVTTILDGTQTVDKLVQFHVPVKICGGATTGFTWATGFPIDYTMPLSWPAGVALSAIAKSGKTGNAFVTDFGA